MSEMFQELLSSSPYAIIELFELHLVQALHGSSEVVRFHAGVNQTLPSGAVVWQSKDYQPLPIEVEGFEYTGNGQLPRPKVRVSNLLGNISAILLGVNEFTPGNDLTGAKFVRIRTLSRFLDPVNFDGNVNPYGTPDPTAEMPQEIYYVDRKASENRQYVEFELAAVFDLATVRSPKRQCIANICQWVYRSAECGYTGGNFYDENDNPVSGTPAPNISPTFSTLAAGQILYAPNYMVSANGWYKAVMQTDGNLVVYAKNGLAVWASNTVFGTANYYLRNTFSGNLKINNQDLGTTIWYINSGNATAGVTSVAFVPGTGASGIAWYPTDRTGREGAFGWELFGRATNGASASASLTINSPTDISTTRSITIRFTATGNPLPAGNYSGEAYGWSLTGVSIVSNTGLWNLNETFNATVNVSNSNPFRNNPFGLLTQVGPQIQITGTQGFENNSLVMQNDGNLVLQNQAGTPIWAAGYSSSREPSLATVNDVCGKRITSCKLRFGDNNPLPFGSFPSIGTYYG